MRTVLTGREFRLAALSALIALAMPFGLANSQEDAKWFVLRHDQTGDCWTALLIEVDGEYAHAFAQKASGPYSTKSEALKREKELEKEGNCNMPKTQ